MGQLICYQKEKNNPIYLFSLQSKHTSIINKTNYSSPYFLRDGTIKVNIGYWYYPHIQGSSHSGQRWISQKNLKIDRDGNILIDSLVDTLPYPMFDTHTKKMIDSIGYYIRAIDWTRDSSKYVFADYGDTIHFYDYIPRVSETSKFISSVKFWDTCITIGLSPDGSKIAISTRDSILLLDKNGNKKAVRYLK
jgi:hypothetical protein